ncbi:hypothetical protein ACK2M2_12175 [Acinetobacter sp. TY1]|uniref:hypothetical protein n=1 Tax=Acinetobacter sp. TY1 TaxID=3387626 RepID=UPI003AF7C051
MTTLNYTVYFKKTVLASFIGLCLSQSCFALETLSDESLSDTTGEGIALLPTDAYMVFREAGANESATNVLTDRTKDTGYIHYIPVGPLSSEAKASGAGKADLYMYGLALSKSDDDSNSRLANTAAKAAISSWGTATNPWILKVDTAKNIPTFTQDVGSSKNTETGDVTYMALEAPLYEVGAKDAIGADAYKLKLAMWADAFQRNPNVVEGTTTAVAGQNPLDSGMIARIRLQAIWNNFSINGSKIQLFQTLGGATGQTGLSPFYDKTLGLSGVLRFNSGEADRLRLTGNAGVVTESSSLTTWDTIHSGQNSTLSATATASSGNCGNAGTGAIGSGVGCQYIVQKGTRTDTKTLSGSTWGVTDEYKNNVLRLSTRETATSANGTQNLYTPAINGGLAPSFDANEGISIYNLNTNLVLGNLYQPLIVGSDGKNFSLELARIPNKESIYKQIYTDYGYNGVIDASYKGSTCNVYSCGSSITLGGKTYQGSNATHSSISIGSVYGIDGNKNLKAYDGADAIGIVFGSIQNTGPVTTTGTSIGYQYAQRQIATSNWQQNSKCTNSIFGNCTSVSNTQGTLTQWQYSKDGNWVNSLIGWQNTPTNAATCSTSFGNGQGGCNNTSGSTPMNGSIDNKTWSSSNLNGATWQAGLNAGAAGLVGVGAQSGMSSTNMAPNPTVPTASFTNLGSAVIDGMLIQHMKITTKGL